MHMNLVEVLDVRVTFKYFRSCKCLREENFEQKSMNLDMYSWSMWRRQARLSANTVPCRGFFKALSLSLMTSSSTPYCSCALGRGSK